MTAAYLETVTNSPEDAFKTPIQPGWREQGWGRNNNSMKQQDPGPNLSTRRKRKTVFHEEMHLKAPWPSQRGRRPESTDVRTVVRPARPIGKIVRSLTQPPQELQHVSFFSR